MYEKYWYRDILISQQTQETKMVQTENSGLTIVYPVDRIKEVVLLDWNRHREGVINTFGTYIPEKLNYYLKFVLFQYFQQYMY